MEIIIQGRKQDVTEKIEKGIIFSPLKRHESQISQMSFIKLLWKIFFKSAPKN